MRRQLRQRRERLLRMKLLRPVEQVAFRLGNVRIGDATIHRAHRSARLFVVEADAFGAERGVDDEDVLTLADGLVRALRLASAAVDALFGNHRRHRSVSSNAEPSADPDGLDVDELADAFAGELAPVASLLDAAERQARIALYHSVDEHRTGLQLGRELLLLGQIVGERSRAQSERGVVGLLDGLIQALDAHDRSDRSEDLLPPGSRAVGL